MAHRRYAKALVSRSDIQIDQWMEEIRSQYEGSASKDHVRRVASTVLRKADPKQYLLSHATIVASVDTYAPKNVKVGRQLYRGSQIEVKFPDFRIRPEGHSIINNNGDAWGRALLLSTYRTFVGAPNFLEHIQLPELSKGFIIDAIARDLGKSVYIDILVGTDRKHSKLVSDILSGDISALSMGCISLFTQCTKCGNVAVDDSQLCPCILYEGKGNMFMDEDGVQHPIAELIGHVTVPNSNQFIEASWVKAPAFKGAVRRNFLNADPIIATKTEEASKIYDIKIGEQQDDSLKRAASSKRKADEPPAEDAPAEDAPEEEAPTDEGEDGAGDDAPAELGSLDFGGGGSSGGGSSGDSGEAPAGDTEKAEPAGIESLLEKAQELFLQTMVKSLSEKLEPKPEDVKAVTSVTDWESSGGGNDNIVRSSIDFSRKLRKTFSSQKLIRWAERAHKIVHVGGLKSVKSNRLTAQDLIILSWIEDCVNNRQHASSLYKIAMKVGSINSYPTYTSFLAACKMRLGRTPTESEKRFFVTKGRIVSLVD